MEFSKYHKIKILGDIDNLGILNDPEDELVIEEKMDGANFRFMINKGKIIFGSRTQELLEDSEHKYYKNFQKCISHIQEAYENVDKEVLKHSEGKIFFGESMVRHTMAYNWEEIPVFLGFDIFDIKSGNYLGHKNKIKLFDSWNLSSVPTIKGCKVKDLGKVDDTIVPDSKYFSLSSDDTKAEGIVIKNYDKQLFAKYVREKFKEKNRNVFGGNKKYAKTDDEYFTLMYCTNARIDKCVFKMIDEGKTLVMELMGDLLNMVYKDIWEENWNEIAFSKKTTNLLQFKKLVSKRCLEVLKIMIINNRGNQN